MDANNKHAVVGHLRAIAKRIERGQVEVRSTSHNFYSREDRSPVTTVRVSFAPRKRRKEDQG